MRIFHVFFTLLCLSVVAAEDPTKAKSSAPRYQISLNNGLLPFTNSTVGLSELSRELLALGTYPINLLNEKYGESNPFLCIPSTVLYGLLYTSFVTVPVSMIAFHEFGHARGLLAVDSDSQPGYHLKLRKHDTLENHQNPYALSHMGSTYYHMLGSLYQQLGGMPFVLPQAARDLIQSFYDKKIDRSDFIQRAQAMVDSPKINAIPVWAGGFNNQSIIAGRIEDYALEQKASHLFDTATIVLNKLMPQMYLYEYIPNDLRDADELVRERRIPKIRDIDILGKKRPMHNPEEDIRYETVNIMRLMNDHGSIERHYRMKGIIPDYDHKMSHTGCALSVWLSGSTYQGIYNLYRYLRYQEISNEPLSYQGVYLPNTSFFFTSEELSLRFRQSYRYSDDLLFMASYETVYKGNSAHELGLTVRYRVVQFYDMLVTIGGFASFGKNGWRGAQAHLKLEAPISRWFHVNGAYYLWDSNTLDGERQIPSQEKSNIDHEFMLGFSLRF